MSNFCFDGISGSSILILSTWQCRSHFVIDHIYRSSYSYVLADKRRIGNVFEFKDDTRVSINSNYSLITCFFVDKKFFHLLDHDLARTRRYRHVDSLKYDSLIGVPFVRRTNIRVVLQHLHSAKLTHVLETKENSRIFDLHNFFLRVVGRLHQVTSINHVFIRPRNHSLLSFLLFGSLLAYCSGLIS